MPSNYLWAAADPLACEDAPYCYDVALYNQRLEDDFDKIGTLFVDYVKSALMREVRNGYHVGQVSRARCAAGAWRLTQRKRHAVGSGTRPSAPESEKASRAGKCSFYLYAIILVQLVIPVTAYP